MIFYEIEYMDDFNDNRLERGGKDNHLRGWMFGKFN